MQILPLLLCVKLRMFLTSAVPNPPDSGKYGESKTAYGDLYSYGSLI